MKVKETYAKLDKILCTDKNYGNYKKLLCTRRDPIVPYLGVFLRDLTFIEVGNSTYSDEDRTIVNFDKLRMIATILHDFSKYKQNLYDFKPFNHVRDAFLHFLPAKDEETLYAKSVKLEPKNTNKKSLIGRLRT